MTIETKCNRRDEVFFMKDNEVASDLVAEIDISVDDNGPGFNTNTTIKYRIDSDEWFSEDAIFATKQDLLNSL